MARHVRFINESQTLRAPAREGSHWGSLLRAALVVAVLTSYGFSGTGVSAHGVAAPAHVKMGGTLVIDNETGALWDGNFSPFNPGVNGNGINIGIIYESLIYINVLNGKQTPMLATGYRWANGNKTLIFTIRQGVKWTDGKPFDAGDVAFTFNLMKKYSALDLQAVWSVLKSVRQQGNYTVVMTFKSPAVPFFYYIADLDAIIAQHVWSKIKNPVTYVDKHPIGTGPFILSSSSTPQTIAYARNPHYWQTGRPYLSKVLYPAFTSNPPANLLLAQGKADWGGQFIPNIQTYYIRRDPQHYHYWFPPDHQVDLWPNLTVKPLNNKLVRQSLAYGIDRQRVSTIGEYGYEPAANQTDVLLPTFSNWYDRALASKYNYTYNPSKAKALLQKAGIKGTLSLSVINIGGNTDWVAALGVIRDNLKQVGINLKIENLAQNDFFARLYNGRYQLAYNSGPPPAPNPYYDLRGVLYSANTAPIGKAAASNYERWRGATTDKLIDQFAGTTNGTQQYGVVHKLEGIMLEQVPVIPVTEGVSWYQYNTTRFTGWPTKQDPYVDPAPYDYPDTGILLSHVHLK
jgi:peptide/nickel transport system substrate-binding protein